MIEFLNVTHLYGQTRALNGLKLTVESGDAFGFIGPNGAGKTTAIRILATLLEPTEGDARVCGFSVIDEPQEVRQRIGYMPDQFGLYDGLKVREFLELFAALRGESRRKWPELIDGVLELTDLTARADSLTEELSKGMRQRLCLAKTLLHDPEVLLLDEPAAGLDPRARVELKELFKELRRMGKTLFVSSHILPELAGFCNVVGILQGGSLLTGGSVDTVLGRVAGQRRWRVRVLRNPEGAAEAIGQCLEDARLVPEADGRLALETAASDEQLADVLQRLVEEGHRPLEFFESAEDLEMAFMRLTAGGAP